MRTLIVSIHDRIRGIDLGAVRAALDSEIALDLDDPAVTLDIFLSWARKLTYDDWQAATRSATIWRAILAREPAVLRAIVNDDTYPRWLRAEMWVIHALSPTTRVPFGTAERVRAISNQRNVSSMATAIQQTAIDRAEFVIDDNVDPFGMLATDFATRLFAGLVTDTGVGVHSDSEATALRAEYAAQGVNLILTNLSADVGTSGPCDFDVPCPNLLADGRYSSRNADGTIRNRLADALNRRDWFTAIDLLAQQGVERAFEATERGWFREVSHVMKPDGTMADDHRNRFRNCSLDAMHTSATNYTDSEIVEEPKAVRDASYSEWAGDNRRLPVVAARTMGRVTELPSRERLAARDLLDAMLDPVIGCGATRGQVDAVNRWLADDWPPVYSSQYYRIKQHFTRFCKKARAWAASHRYDDWHQGVSKTEAVIYDISRGGNVTDREE